MTEANVVANFLVRSLQQIDPRPLKGSELAVLAKTAYPDFTPESHGCHSLRDFIRRNAAEIVDFSRAGMDYVYRLKTTQDRLVAEGEAIQPHNSAIDQLTRNPRLWKTFASPDSVFRLYLDARTGIIHSLHSNSKPLPEWREVPKISAEVLLQIGRDFTADLPEVQKSVLAPLLQDPKWWIPFYERLQTLGLRLKWIDFRRRRLREQFERIIGEVGATPQQNPAVVMPPATPEAATPQVQPELMTIRRIASEVVRRMSESELRNLNLPLGHVIDSLTTR